MCNLVQPTCNFMPGLCRFMPVYARHFDGLQQPAAAGMGLLIWPSRRGVPAAAAAGCWYIINWAAGMGLQPKARSRAAGMGLQPKARSSLARSRWRGVVGAEFRLQPRRLLVWGCSRRRGVGLLVWPSRRGVRWRGVPAAAAAGCWYGAADMAIPARSSGAPCPTGGATIGAESLARSRWRGVVGAEFVGAEFRLQPRRLLVWGCSRRRGVGLLVWPSRRGVRWRGVPAAAAAGCWYIINWAAGMGLQPKARSRAAGMGLQPKARSSLARSSLARSSLARSSGCSRRRGVRWRGVVGAEFRLQPKARSRAAGMAIPARSSGCSSRRLLVYH